MKNLSSKAPEQANTHDPIRDSVRGDVSKHRKPTKHRKPKEPFNPALDIKTAWALRIRLTNKVVKAK